MQSATSKSNNWGGARKNSGPKSKRVKLANASRMDATQQTLSCFFGSTSSPSKRLREESLSPVNQHEGSDESTVESPELMLTMEIDTESTTAGHDRFEPLFRTEGLFEDGQLPADHKASNFIIGDGNCLFRCLAFYSPEGQDSHNKTRLSLMNFLKKFHQHFQISHRDIDIFEYCEIMSRDGEPGDELCLAAFCAMTNQPVLVYTLKNSGMNPPMTYSAMVYKPSVSTEKPMLRVVLDLA